MFSCEICNYNANTKAVLARHLTSKKHIKQAELTSTTTTLATTTSTTTSTTTPTTSTTPTTILATTTETELQCKNCNKEFKFKGGLERHMKICKKKEVKEKEEDEDEDEEKEVMDDDKKEYQHNMTRLIVEIIRNRYEFEIETEMLKKAYEQKIAEIKNEYERALISKELEIKKLQVQIQVISKKK